MDSWKSVRKTEEKSRLTIANDSWSDSKKHRRHSFFMNFNDFS